MTRRDARAAANDHPVAYEPYELRIGPILLSLGGLAALTLLVLFLMKRTERTLDRQMREGAHAIHSLAATSELPPEPRLQETPALDLQRFRAREEERLSTYGWVDRQAELVHIPIERAMEIVAKEGLPVRR